MQAEATPPQSREAEEGVLGSLLIDPEAISEVAALITPDDFYNWGRRTIYTAILSLAQRHIPADYLTLCEELRRQGQLDEVGGASEVAALIGAVPTSRHAEYYARIVAKKAECRRLLQAAAKIAQLACEEGDEALTEAESLILAIGQQRAHQSFVSMAEYFPAYLNRLEARSQGGAVRGISTNIRMLDALLGGLQPGKLYVPAARPGVGKTTICQNIAYRGARKHGIRVGFFSLEMSEDDLMDRFMAMHTQINSLALQNGALSPDEWDTVVKSEEVMSRLGIFFRHTPGIYLDDLASMARRLVKRHHIDVLIIDYLQLVRARIEGKRIGHREMEVAEIARGLKMLAGELSLPILAPAQISRAVEHSAVLKDERTGLSYRMPMLADLRESGELEQSADVVMFLARAEEDETKVKLHVAKHRNGPTGSIDLYFEGATTRFFPLSMQHGPLTEE
jgi:replicative DNA helicase